MALGQALGAGRFLELRLLEFHNYQIDAAGMEALVAALSAAEAPQLEVPSLFSTNMGDEGIKSLAVALREGRLGSRLRELTLGNDYDHTTESGCLALLTATMEGQENLTCLSHLCFDVSHISLGCAEAFVVGVMLCCPSITQFNLGTDLSDADKETVRDAAIHAARGRQVDVFLSIL